MASETVVWWLGLSLPGSKEQGIMGRWVHPFEILLISPRVIKVVSCNFYRLVFIETSLLKETKQSPIFYEQQPTLRFCHQIKIAKSFLFQWLTPVKILIRRRYTLR